MLSKLLPNLLVILLLVIIALGFAPVARSSGEQVTPTPLPIGNPPVPSDLSPTVLSNADFEAGLLGWTTWSEDTGKPTQAESLDYVVAPFFSIEHNPVLIKTGQAALHVGRIYDPWHAGLKRAIVVAPNATVRFCISGRLYASNRDFGHEPSWAALDGRMQVGLYPEGDADWNTAGVIWSAPVNPHDEWRELCVEATAGASGRITLLTSVNYRGLAAKHLDAWWDDAALSVSGGASEPSLAGPINQMLGLTTTRPVSVLLLIPAQPSTAYTVWPAQIFASAQGLTLALVSTNTQALLNGGLVPAPTPGPASPTTAPTPQPTSTPPATSTPAPTATSTAAPTVTAKRMATAEFAKPIATPSLAPTMPDVASPQPIAATPLLSLGAVLVVGVVGAAYVMSRR